LQYKPQKRADWGFCGLMDSEGFFQFQQGESEPGTKSTLAFGIGQHENAAAVLVSPDFGCVQFEKKEPDS
jgi:hypothetical protein